MSTMNLRRWLAAGAILATLACAEKRRPPEPPPPVPVLAVPAEPPLPIGETPCGTAGLPDCPLQAWMDARLNTLMSDGNFPALARSLRELADDAPPGFANWRRWAEKAAEAADRNDDTEVKVACSGCHDEHRDLYRRSVRGRPLRAANN